MDRPLVSVVIPIYNVEAYLDRCLASVVGQTYENLEIILVDDGSPDRCPEMCDGWKERDNRIQVIHKENAGLGMARNTGMERATGKYIFFFDSDDYVADNLVSLCVDRAQQDAADVVIYGACDVYEDGRIEKKAVRAPATTYSGADIAAVLLPQMFTYGMGFGISAWGKMYRLAAIRDNGLSFMSEREIISEDAYFALEFYPKIRTASIIEDNLYYYCKRDTSLSRAYKPGRQVQNDRFIQKACAHIDQEKLPDELRNHLIVRYHMYTVAAAKQLLASDLPRSEYKQELHTIFGSDVLRSTLQTKILRLHNASLKLFFLLLKYRLYFMCLLLIRIKNRE